jgi:hypothetical protein
MIKHTARSLEVVNGRNALEIERFRNMIEAIRDQENNILKPHEKAQAAEIERLEAEVVSLDISTRKVTKRMVLLIELFLISRERERCAKIADDMVNVFLSEEYAVNQPLSSHGERFACREIAVAIRKGE